MVDLRVGTTANFFLFTDKVVDQCQAFGLELGLARTGLGRLSYDLDS